MPSLLQRQIFKEIANLFVLAVGVLLTLILISRAVQMRELFLGLDLGILDTVLLFGYMTPLFLMLVIPIACMLSVFLTFLRMSTDRELVALRAGGINIYQMLPAPLLFSVICMLLTLWVSLHWLAWGMGHFRETILEIANTRARVVVQPGVFNTDFPNLVLFARQVNPGDGDMSQVLVDDRSHPERHMTILAPEGRFDTDTERGELVFLLEDGKIYTTDKKGSSVLAFDCRWIPSSRALISEMCGPARCHGASSPASRGRKRLKWTPTMPTSWRWSATSAGPIRWRASP